MFMNQSEIEDIASRRHACPNVRKGVKLMQELMQAVNDQSDGWAYWTPPSKSCEKLQALLATAGNLHHGTNGTITDAQLKAAISPIRSMVTTQKTRNSFKFDVDAALQEKGPAKQYENRIFENGVCIDIAVVSSEQVAAIRKILAR